MEGTHEVGRRPFMPDSTLSRRSAALMGAWTRPPLLPKTHKFHTETAGEPFYSFSARCVSECRAIIGFVGDECRVFWQALSELFCQRNVGVVPSGQGNDESLRARVD